MRLSLPVPKLNLMCFEKGLITMLRNAVLLCVIGSLLSPARGQNQDIAALRQRAEAGDAAAQYELGYKYRNGWNAPKDHAQAVAWFRKSADQGFAVAQERLGYCYLEGLGVPVDYAQAIAWFEKSANQGRGQSAIQLGEMYESGQGIPQDFAKALAWYRKASPSAYSKKASLHISALLQKAPQLAASNEQRSAQGQEQVQQQAVTSNISLAQDSTAKKADDTEASAPVEVSMGDTLDFIKRKLTQERAIPKAGQYSDGSIERRDFGSTTYKLSELNAQNGRLQITELSNGPLVYSIQGGSDKVTILSFVSKTTKAEFSLATLDATLVSVERGLQTTGELESYQSYRVVLKTKDDQKLIANETDSTFTHLPGVPDQPEEKTSGKSNMLGFWFADKQTATRVAKAFVHAIILASPKAKPDVF